MAAAVTETRLPLKLHSRGKVRDTYDLGGKLLIVATDRISAFDVVLREGIPLKGAVLTQLSAYWFRKTSGVVRNHFVSARLEDFADAAMWEHAGVLRGRSMLVEKAKPLKIECVVRGYLSGSAWKSYKAGKSVSGLRLPEGLKESGRLPEPIFTPTTKADAGHDEEMSMDAVARLVGADAAAFVEEKSLEVYSLAAGIAEKKGIIIADTKIEFGIVGGELVVIDELLTPDSSRFWPLDRYEEGRPQQSFDKQFVRDYLESTGWNKEPPPPPIPNEVVEGTSKRYAEAFERLTGGKLEAW